MVEYLGQTLESALGQTYEPLEVVVMDNASIDGSQEVIKSFARRDARLRWGSNSETVPMSVNWNRCLQLARGSYFNLLSADDLLSSEFVVRCMKQFSRFPQLAYVATERSSIDGAGQVTETPPFFANSGIIPGLEQSRINLLAHHFLPVQLLIRRDLATSLGNYDERYDYACDIDLMLKLSLHGDVGYIQESLCRYRTHAENITSKYKLNKLGVMEIYRLKHHILSNLPTSAESLKNHKNEMLQGIAKVCLVDAHQALSTDNRVLARECLSLAQAFWVDVDKTLRYEFLAGCISQRHTWSHVLLNDEWNAANIVNVTGSSGPPYPLPSGSQVLHDVAIPDL